MSSSLNPTETFLQFPQGVCLSKRNSSTGTGYTFNLCPQGDKNALDRGKKIKGKVYHMFHKKLHEGIVKVVSELHSLNVKIRFYILLMKDSRSNG